MGGRFSPERDITIVTYHGDTTIAARSTVRATLREAAIAEVVHQLGRRGAGPELLREVWGFLSKGIRVNHWSCRLGEFQLNGYLHHIAINTYDVAGDTWGQPTFNNISIGITVQRPDGVWDRDRAIEIYAEQRPD